MAAYRRRKKHEIGGHYSYDCQVSHEHLEPPQWGAAQRRHPPATPAANWVVGAEFGGECEQKHQEERETVVVVRLVVRPPWEESHQIPIPKAAIGEEAHVNYCAPKCRRLFKDWFFLVKHTFVLIYILVVWRRWRCKKIGGFLSDWDLVEWIK